GTTEDPLYQDARTGSLVSYRFDNLPDGVYEVEVHFAEIQQRRPGDRRFDVTADGRGMTGRSGTALLAEVAEAIGLTSSLQRTVNGCRSWTDHPPGKVVRDLLLMLADGGDALRHLKVLGGQDQRVLNRTGSAGGLV
ncbi:MAG: hypothetical protein GEV09_21125, partial [Pseudonocardiaceae bacterium]|nr:hypothetical protein [Pseudonocardiaceae bacterium]